MTSYKVQMMSREDWSRYMSGDNSVFNIIDFIVQAPNQETAAAITQAQFPNMKVNKHATAIQ